MLNNSFYYGVKNVNKYSINASKTGVIMSPVLHFNMFVICLKVGKQPLIPILYTFFTHDFYIAKKAFSSLLKNTYTHNPQGLLLEPINKI